MPAFPLECECVSMERLPDRFGYHDIHMWCHQLYSETDGTAAGYHAIMVAMHTATDRLTVMHTMDWADIWETDIFHGLTDEYEGARGLSYASDLDAIKVPSESPSKMEESLLLWLKSKKEAGGGAL